MAKNREPVLIANRGEIALRIARTCKALGFPTVAIYSTADRQADHVQFCDQAVWVGEAPPGESYLNIDRILEAARQTGAKYVHPGYGFLSEKSDFVKACQREGLIFIGPSGEAIDKMGDKIQARETVDAIGVPRVPGSPGALATGEEALEFADQAGFPVLLKAKAGGGGKGMRRVDRREDLISAFEAASREAQSSFGDGSMYLEKLIVNPHHVEIQVFGDGKGGAIHLGERECSIQRRHQKIWEESPSPLLERFPDTRPKMFEAAENITKHLNYSGAGTVEFVADESGNFYFLEMNTRLQVEHPVTEAVTGVDLVKWQLLLAAGEFELPQKSPERRGHAVEVRVYAEDPQSFLPAPGQIGTLDPPNGPFLRWDSAFMGPGEVTQHYDPMIAKLIVWGGTREEAIAHLKGALDDTRVEPLKDHWANLKSSLKTNLRLLKRLTRNPEVIRGHTPTSLIADHPELTEEHQEEASEDAAIALSLYQILADTESSLLEEEQGTQRPWGIKARWEATHHE